MDKGFDDLNSFLKNSYEKNKLKRKKKNKYLIILVNNYNLNWCRYWNKKYKRL